MWRHSQNSTGCYNCECSEEEEAHPVEHHRGELPVCLHRAGLLVLTYLVSDHLELLQDEPQFPLKWSHFDTIKLEVTRIWVGSKRTYKG